jgi:sodium-dependent dicarboxylate transporter 2/3/5
MSRIRVPWKIPLGLLIFALIIFMPQPSGMNIASQRVAAVAALMACFWITEAVHIAVTALIPLVLFPILGIADAKGTASMYANDLIFLFLGGFIIALAIQRWNLHLRIALRTIQIVGYSPPKLVLGFMTATAFLSLWMSNTACAMIMVPIGIAVIEKLKGDTKITNNRNDFAKPLLLGIAYGSSIGGMGTLIGTPPNLVLANALETMYGFRIDFGSWMMVGIPLVAIFLPLAWLVLTRVVYRLKSQDSTGSRDLIRQELERLGSMSPEEKRVLTVFVLVVFFWIFSTPKDFGAFTLPGVESFIPFSTESTIAMVGAVSLFFIPAGKGKRLFLMDWDNAKKLPWGILVLFGGGLAIASGFKDTGLATWIGAQVESFAQCPTLILVAIIVTILIFLTDFTSNTATAAMMLPILAGVATGIGENPLLLMIPATIATSCAFMLPAGTPPNAIIFSSGQVTIMDMVKAGIFLNIIALILITAVTYLIAVPVFGIEVGVLPVWAH